MSVTKRCSVCGRFRHYADDDVYCLTCGNNTLETAHSCGRGYEYALDAGNEGTSLHCPRCGKALKGRSAEFDP